MSSAHREPDHREAEVLARLVAWAEGQPLVRALILESSRAVGQAPLDAFSDYDVLVVVSDLRPFVEDDAWLSAYGAPLVMLHDTLSEQSITQHSRLVLYEDYTKVDYIVWPIELLRQVVERQELPELLDWGYRALVDKDGLAARLPVPTRTAHIPRRPTKAEYLALVEEFWWESTYVAKNLWRDELMFAKYNLEYVMKLDLLRRLLEWRVEVDRDWSWKPGLLGRGLKQVLPAETWAEVEATYAGADIEANWAALFATTALFRRIATEVGGALGYAYPHGLDQRVTAYLEAARRAPRE